MKIIEYENLLKVNASFEKEFKSVFTKVLNNGWYILGNFLQSFEANYSKYLGVNFCLGVASGLDALNLALISLNLPAKSEIIVPSNTYIATILAIINSGHIPVLVEPNIHSYNIDPTLIEDKITSKTRAIIVVHLYGKCCDMENILKITKKFNLKIIEDCAQSHGAKFKNFMSGSFGDISAHSFYPTKNLGALGDAGAIATNNQDYFHTIKKLRNYGSERKYYNEIIGFNSRLDELQAAFLNIKLQYLDQINDHKRKIAELYNNNLKNDFIKPVQNNDYLDVFHIYNIRHPRRDDLRDFLLKNGIKTEIHYPVSPSMQNAISHLFKGQNFPISEEIHKTTLSLPISYGHTDSDIYQVIEIINKY